MDPVQITAAAALVAVIIAAIGLAATAIYRIGKLTEATNRFPQEMKAGFQGIHVEIQGVHDRIGQSENLAEERFRRHEEMIRHNEELIRSDGARTRDQIRNLHQAIMSHSHDEDGNIIFRIPPPEPDE